MQIRQLKRTLSSLGLELHAVDGNFADATNIRLKAPDGTVGKFTISRVDDPTSDKINTSQFKRFARDHSHSQDLPGMIELDVLNVTPKGLSSMDVAVGVVVAEHDPDAIKIANRMFRDQPLMNPVPALIASASLPEPPPVVPKGIARALAKLEKAPMPKPTLTLTTAMDSTTDTKAKTPRKSPKTIDRIGQVEFFKLCTTLNEIDLIGVDSLTKLADKLSKAHGRKIAVSTAEDALKATGRKLDKVQVEVTDAQAVIARTLTALLIKLSEPVPAELRRLCGEIE